MPPADWHIMTYKKEYLDDLDDFEIIFENEDVESDDESHITKYRRMKIE